MKNTKYVATISNAVIIIVLVLSFTVAYIAAGNRESASLASKAIYKGNETTNSVALMFNVYEHTDNVNKIMAIFEEYGYLTTFFVGGIWVSKNANTIVKMHSSGFEIGNHGYLHRDHANLNYDENIKEIRLTGRLASEILKDFDDYKGMSLFAPPSGSIGEAMFSDAVIQINTADLGRGVAIGGNVDGDSGISTLIPSCQRILHRSERGQCVYLSPCPGLGVIRDLGITTVLILFQFPTAERKRFENPWVLLDTRCVQAFLHRLTSE